MDINRLGSLQVLADYNQHNSRLADTLNRISTGQKAPTPREDPILWGDIQQLKQYADTLAGFTDNLNRGAASVQVALASMEASRQHLLQLEEKLNSAFAELPGSQGRASDLKAYNALHRYLDDTAKAPDAGARRILDDPDSYPDAGDLEIRAGENSFSITLRSREIHSGADGLNVPRAGEAAPSELVTNAAAPPVIADINNASNAEIAEMLSFIELAKADLRAKAKALSVDARAIEDAEGFNNAYILRNRNQVDEINIPNLDAEAVLVQSFQVKNSLALSGLTGLRDSQKLLLSLLNQG